MSDLIKNLAVEIAYHRLGYGLIENWLRSDPYDASGIETRNQLGDLPRKLVAKLSALTIADQRDLGAAMDVSVHPNRIPG